MILLAHTFLSSGKNADGILSLILHSLPFEERIMADDREDQLQREKEFELDLAAEAYTFCHMAGVFAREI